MVAVQLNLFEDRTEMTDLRDEVKAIAESTANVRRGLFARYAALEREHTKLFFEMEELREQIAQMRSHQGA